MGQLALIAQFLKIRHNHFQSVQPEVQTARSIQFKKPLHGSILTKVRAILLFGKILLIVATLYSFNVIKLFLLWNLPVPWGGFAFIGNCSQVHNFGKANRPHSSESQYKTARPLFLRVTKFLWAGCKNIWYVLIRSPLSSPASFLVQIFFFREYPNLG